MEEFPVQHAPLFTTVLFSWVDVAICNSYLAAAAQVVISTVEKLMAVGNDRVDADLPTYALDAGRLFFKPLISRGARPGNAKGRQRLDTITMFQVFEQLSRVCIWLSYVRRK